MSRTLSGHSHQLALGPIIKHSRGRLDTRSSFAGYPVHVKFLKSRTSHKELQAILPGSYPVACIKAAWKRLSHGTTVESIEALTSSQAFYQRSVWRQRPNGGHSDTGGANAASPFCNLSPYQFSCNGLTTGHTCRCCSACTISEAACDRLRFAWITASHNDQGADMRCMIPKCRSFSG